MIYKSNDILTCHPSWYIPTEFFVCMIDSLHVTQLIVLHLLHCTLNNIYTTQLIQYTTFTLLRANTNTISTLHETDLEVTLIVCDDIT